MRKSTLLFIVTATLVPPGCANKADPGDEPPTEPRKSEVPAELVGTWEHGSIDFVRWENYKEGYWAGRNATPMREAMVIGKNGEAKFYRYEFAVGLYEELIDCEGTVSFDGETFTFAPTKGRKRFIDTRYAPNSKDRALTVEELNQPKLAGKRKYAYVGTSDPVVLKITVPGSAPYNWFKKQ